jgi:DNA replication protein DnaC
MSVCEVGVCDGSGWIEVDEGTARPCECRRLQTRRRATLTVGTGIPKRFRGMSLDRAPIVNLDQWLKRYLRDWTKDLDKNLAAGKGLWLYGDVGTGKTTIAMFISETAMKKGHSVAIYSLPRLLAEIRETFGEGRATYSDLLHRLTSVELLQLDDVGSGGAPEWVLDQLFAVVNERWQDQRSMILTSTLEPGVLKQERETVVDEQPQHRLGLAPDAQPSDRKRPQPKKDELDVLRERLGWRTVSRLSEMCERLPIMGNDRRMQDPSDATAAPADAWTDERGAA